MTKSVKDMNEKEFRVWAASRIISLHHRVQQLEADAGKHDRNIRRGEAR